MLPFCMTSRTKLPISPIPSAFNSLIALYSATSTLYPKLLTVARTAHQRSNMATTPRSEPPSKKPKMGDGQSCMYTEYHPAIPTNK